MYPFPSFAFHPPPTPMPSLIMAATMIPLRRAAAARPPKENNCGSWLEFALLVFFTFVTVGVASAVLGSAMLGFSVYGAVPVGEL